MSQRVFSRVLSEVETVVAACGRAALCQIVRTRGSTPGKVGWKLLVRPDGTHLGNLGGGAFEARVAHDAAEKLAQDRPCSEVKRYYFTEEAVRGEATGMVCGGLAEVFLEVLTAPPLLVVCGGGPVGQALARAAALCELDLLVVEDREAFRQSELFPERAYLAAVGRDYRDGFLDPYLPRDLYVAVVTRCWETDTAALASVLRQAPPRLRYLGLMGSRRKIGRVREELDRQGLSLDGVPFHAPIGLPIGGDSPAEIAVSILGEIVQVRNRAD